MEEALTRYIQSSNCITGDQDHLYERLKRSIKNARKIDLIVAFLMESGVRLLVDDFNEAVKNGTTIRILCGNYLNITQPQALYLLKDALGDNVDLRFYNVPNKSFHPKAYIFEYDDCSDMYIGSSNVSRSALTDGIEWNYRISSKTNPEDCNRFRSTFEDLFFNHSIIVDDDEMRRYSKKWRRPRILADIEKGEHGSTDAARTLTSQNIAAETIAPNRVEHNLNPCKIVDYISPRGPQIEALYELKKTRFEGFGKGLVVAATGVGKTFLAAFDSKPYKNILFLAHREEILSQAEKTFSRVKPEAITGFFTGTRKDTECDILFATVQTLGKKEYLNMFSPDKFDYIIIDEFHHAVSSSYINVIEYFEPEFLLGLTATPERLDNQDVFALCDYNLVYEARLKEAINKGWLVPFRYYGIYDETNYNSIDYKNGKYDERQLEQILSKNDRAQLILRHYQKYRSSIALGFCSSRNHALFMAEYFSRNGVASCAVISGMNMNSLSNNVNTNNNYRDYVVERKRAISMLKNSEIKVLFSVDMFNEGLDIPEVDMVMFLRPTESPTVFLQQLGRGLRKYRNKKYVNVLDFIGNYKKANLIPFFLSGDMKNYNKLGTRGYIPDEDEYPDGCFVDFDLRIIDLFKRMDEAQKGLYEKVIDEYYSIKDKRGERPLRLSMYTYMEEELYYSVSRKSDINIFRDYLSFLKKINELDDAEICLIGTKAHAFIRTIENTKMSKLYKMPILLAFYNNGNIKLAINDEDIYKSFKDFYSHGSNAIDMLRDKSTAKYKEWGKREYVSLAKRNPIRFLMQSSPDFFYESDEHFCLNPSLEEFINNDAFINHFKDVIDYRARRFYKERLINKSIQIYKQQIQE